MHHKLAQADIHQTFQLVTHQRGTRPFSGDALLVDGPLFSRLLPDTWAEVIERPDVAALLPAKSPTNNDRQGRPRMAAGLVASGQAAREPENHADAQSAGT